MPKIKTSRKKYPEGWANVQLTLDEFQIKMREVENESHEGKKKNELMWGIFKIHHQRSKYIYELFYKKREISRELYEFCLNEGYADKNLIAKWKKLGYERLCCLKCIQTKENSGSTCICRVPREKLEEEKTIECQSCGCKGVCLNCGAINQFISFICATDD
ncbi:putative RNA splicing factor [Cavenderia fasciculata]|uniref:RNA splicing factor n=1 Tax=Cavenderia fasciculata TaxID=261658 RepID=F4PTM1_CACFS|nr:putative RNA splicing factor [Cavenderia fasciculata]EGG21691.1 putative RNA splicing factor [Cavenderia fasciculata]|eukprot:XP_004359541.1 putative RNA splicing factor [Cavenderia fasciculata]